MYGNEKGSVRGAVFMLNTCMYLCAGWGGWYGSGPPPTAGQISASASDSSLGSTTSYTSAASKEGSEKLLGESKLNFRRDFTRLGH